MPNDFVTVADYDGTVKGRTHNWWRNWSTDKHPAIGYAAACLGWLIHHPVALAAAGSSVWLLFHGWPLWTVLVVGFVPQLAWSGRSLAGVLAAAPRQRGWSQILPTVSMWWRIRRAWRVATTKAGIKQPGRAGTLPQLRSYVLTHAGMSALVDSGNWGYTQEEMATLSDRAGAAALSSAPVRWLLERLPMWALDRAPFLIPSARTVTITPEDGMGTVRIAWAFSDPLAELVPITSLTRPPSGMWCIGSTEHGEPAYIWRHLPMLVAGMQGSGKSNLIWTIIASALMADEPFELWVADPKGGVELGELGRAYEDGHRAIVKSYARSGPDLREQVTRLHNRMEMRERWMRESRSRFHTPTVEQPRILWLNDELMRAHSHYSVKPSVEPQMVDILADGRALGITLIDATQIPFGHAIGEKVTYLFPQRIVKRISHSYVTSALLGEQAEHLGARATRIKESTPGVGYLYMDRWPTPVRYRDPYITDEMTRLLARGVLPEGLARAHADEHPELEAPRGLKDNRDHVLYRWDAPVEGIEHNGKVYTGCLYVGISMDVSRRAMEHLSTREKALLMNVGVTCEVVRKWTAADCADEIIGGRTVKAVAEDYEAELIRQLQPPLNIAHNGRRHRELTRG
jgi:predicted GIY-YIG superfamily endonuclease